MVEDAKIDIVLGTQEPTIPLINQMLYLDGVVKESMRLNPVVPAVGRVSTKAFKYNGLEFPKGTEFWIDIDGHHLNPEYFHDPEKFWPERWESANEWLKPGTYLPFSDGPHKYVFDYTVRCILGIGTDRTRYCGAFYRCIGEKMAQLEIRIILAMILREYDFTILPDQNFEMYHDMTGKFKEGLKVMVEKRQS